MKKRKILALLMSLTLLVISFSFNAVIAAPDENEFKPTPKLVDLLDSHLASHEAFPSLYDGYSYDYARDGNWYNPANQCWLSKSNWSQNNYLQLNLDNSYKLSEIKFSLRQPISDDSFAWIRQGTAIYASNDPAFGTYDVLWYSEDDPGSEIISVNIKNSEFGDNNYKYIRFAKTNVNNAALTEVQIFGYEEVIDLLTSHLVSNVAFPSLYDGYSYDYARDGNWYNAANRCWLSKSDWNQNNYLQLNLDNSYNLTEIKFTLRQPESGDSYVWIRQGTAIYASNDAAFGTYDVLWYSEDDPGSEIISVNVKASEFCDNKYQYIRFAKTNVNNIALTEVQIFGYEDFGNLKGVFELLDNENITTTAYPDIYNGQFVYSNVRNDWWGIGNNDIWYTQDVSNAYLQVGLPDASYVTSIKFSLRPDQPDWSTEAWRKNMDILVSNDPTFATSEMVYSSGITDPSSAPIEVSVNKNCQYIRFKRHSDDGLGVAVSELRVYGYKDKVKYTIDGSKVYSLKNGSELVVDVEWPNIELNSGTLMCINAKYTADGKLIAVDVLPSADYGPSDQGITVGTSNLGAVTKGMYVKTFFWTESIQPLCNYSFIK